MKKILAFTTFLLLSTTAFASEKDALLNTMDSINRFNYKALDMERKIQTQSESLELFAKMTKPTPACNQVLAQYKNTIAKLQIMNPDNYRNQILQPVIAPLSETDATLIHQQISVALKDHKTANDPEPLATFNKAIVTQVEKVVGIKDKIALPSLNVCEFK